MKRYAGGCSLPWGAAACKHQGTHQGNAHEGRAVGVLLVMPVCHWAHHGVTVCVILEIPTHVEYLMLQLYLSTR